VMAFSSASTGKSAAAHRIAWMVARMLKVQGQVEPVSVPEF